MQNFFSITSVVLIISIFFVTLILVLYYIFNKSIVSTYTFNIKNSLINIQSLLIDNNKYKLWWPKFKKFFIYKTRVYKMCDDNQQYSKIIIVIHSNASKELWEIILSQTNSESTNIIVYQKLSLNSKISRILNSSMAYKRDLLIFSKSLKKQFIS